MKYYKSIDESEIFVIEDNNTWKFYSKAHPHRHSWTFRGKDATYAKNDDTWESFYAFYGYTLTEITKKEAFLEIL